MVVAADHGERAQHRILFLGVSNQVGVQLGLREIGGIDIAARGMGIGPHEGGKLSEAVPAAVVGVHQEGRGTVFRARRSGEETEDLLTLWIDLLPIDGIHVVGGLHHLVEDRSLPVDQTGRERAL